MANYSSGPDPEDLVYDDDLGVYVDSNSGDAYYDDEGTESAGFNTCLDD